MKKIAYIEIDTHAEIAQDFMNIMSDSDAFSVDYYFSEKIKNQIKENDQTVYLSDSSMILDQLKVKKYDLIIIGTVHRYFNTFLAIVQKYNTSIIIHNLNFSQISKLNVFKNIFKDDVIFRLKLLLKESLFYSSKVYKNAKNLLVLDEQISSEKHQFLPLFYTKNYEKTENKILTIVIPGGVSQNRRDYQRVFEIIKKIENKENITFVFLGKAKDKELEKLQKLSSNLAQNVNLIYFSERVSLDIFDEWMYKADVLWCPIQQETDFFSQQEIYGKTKMTGNLGDVIKYGKPAVFPKNYSSKLEFIIPEKETIIEQFHDLKNSEFDFQADFNKGKVQKDLEKVLNQLIIT